MDKPDYQKNKNDKVSQTEKSQIVIASTFNADFILLSLEYHIKSLDLPLSIAFAAYNQVFQELLSPESLMSRNQSGLNVVLIRFFDWMRFTALYDANNENRKSISDEQTQLLNSAFDSFINGVKSYCSRSSSPLLILICPSMLTISCEKETEILFEQYYARLCDTIRPFNNASCLSMRDFHKTYNVTGIYDHVGDSMGHVPFIEDYMHLIGAIVIRYYYNLKTSPRKVIAVDCDNTLWNGVCAEDGPAQLSIQGAPGGLQEFLAAQIKQGMLVCLCSKNNENDVWQVFDSIPSMPLKKEDITAYKINWNPKSNNIMELAKELNLGLDSFVFIDDSPMECSDVRINCPQVLTLQWPLDSTDPVKRLSQLWIFDHFIITNEDKVRSQMYKADRIRRQEGEKNRGSWKKFFKELKLEVTIQPVNAESIQRASQLTFRTNQFNFSTVRRNVPEIMSLIDSGDALCLTVEAGDRFGIYGIVGFMILLIKESHLDVDTFLLSCRALGRGIEHQMISRICQEALDRRIKQIKFTFRKSEKNAPAGAFLDLLSKKHKGRWDEPGACVSFDAKTLIKCRFEVSSTGIHEKKDNRDSSLIQRPKGIPDNGEITGFWSSHDTITSLKENIDKFRKEKKQIGTQPSGTPDIILLDSVVIRSVAGKNPTITDLVKQAFEKYLNIDQVQLTDNLLLEKLAIDSKDKVLITSELNRMFGGVPVTILFEHSTFGSLCGYFMKMNKKENIEAPGSNGFQEDKSHNISFEDIPRQGGLFEYSDKDIAITGISCKYPGANNIFEFWNNLSRGQCSISEISQSRWNPTLFYSKEEGASYMSYSKWGGFIDGVYKFDAPFFNISPGQAELMDPQQRLFLETVWALFEDAGYRPDTIEKNTGVFVGVISSDYGLYQNQFCLDKIQTFRNCDYYHIANRISYFFDLQGPSMAVDTACSSSGTAVHLACESIKSGTCCAAIAGGVNLILHPSRFIQYSHVGMLSRDDKCRSFGDNADGTIIGEGVGAILLKSAKQAIADGDNIWGIIKGSFINSGGRTTGFTVPNPLAQAELVRRAFSASRIEPNTISYIETHGTGTPLGDPIEIRGLNMVFGGPGTASNDENKNPSCSIGSVKSNIGHLESGAAIAGIIKVLLQMRYQKLVPSLNSSELNPKINFKQTVFKVQQTLQKWERPVLQAEGKSITFPLRAGISSFGAGGSNSHLIIEEFPSALSKKKSGENKKYLFVLSARHKKQLLAYVNNFISYLSGFFEAGTGFFQTPEMADICYTLVAGREAMDERLAVTASSIKELISTLGMFVSDQHDVPGLYRGRVVHDDSLVSLFSGNAGRSLASTLISENDMDKLARYWISGGILYPDMFPAGARISLPVYPFDGDSYIMPGIMDAFIAPGIKESSPLPGIKTQDLTPVRSKNADNYELFEPVWRKIEHTAYPGTQIVQDILVFGSFDKILLNNLKELQTAQSHVIFISPSDIQFEKDENAYSIDIDDPDQYGLLIHKLIEQKLKISHVIHLWSFYKNKWDEQITGDLLKHGFFSVLNICRSFIIEKQVSHLQFLYFYPGTDQIASPALAAIHGFKKTVEEEYPGINFKTIRIRTTEGEGLGDFITVKILSQEISSAGKTNPIYYNHDEKFELYYKRIVFSDNNILNRTFSPRPDGTYIITGGMGGLGFLLAKHFASFGKCNLALCGRSALDEKIEQRLGFLEKLGVNVRYYNLDISKEEQTAVLIESVKKEFGCLNGIVHAAGILSDSYIINKKQTEVDEVLKPKVHGTVNLDLATMNEDIDFFIMFSSVSAVAGNPGQADYAFASSFLDSFARWRNEQAECGKRKGFSISINWSYWKEGGMRLTPEDLKLYSLQTGLSPLPSDIGLSLFDLITASRIENCVTGYGNISQFDNLLNLNIEIKTDNSPAARIDKETLRQKTQGLLRDILINITKDKPENFLENTLFDSLGIDSIVIRLFNFQAERVLGKISKTILFECQTLGELTDYCLWHYEKQLISHFTVNNNIPVNAQNYRAIPAKISNIKDNRAIELESVKKEVGTACNEQDIAIIGINGQYPKAANLSEYWENLKAGLDCVIEIPQNRWNNNELMNISSSNTNAMTNYCRWGGFLDDVDKFDPLFFNISPKDAKAMDPQERLFLQSAWSALEDAGYNRNELKFHSQDSRENSVGVFVGVTTNDYQLIGAGSRNTKGIIARSLSWSIPNRVSYVLNLKGPSLPVDSACSSSLIALHLACESLKRAECVAAIAGGVNLFLHPFKYILNSNQKMLSPTGRCYAFSSKADGFVPAEGVGALVLKRLDKAIADRDHIYCLIKGTFINHGGKTNGFMVPNPDAQAELIENAIKCSGISSRSISYIEAHGTGTILGDPIEINGLTKAFKKFSPDNGYCSIGSVKSNIGHAEAAAGIASISKVILQMTNKWIVPSIHTEKLNPDIDFSDTPFFVQQTGGEWKKPVVLEQGKEITYPRRAGISSFGAGGANAHVILEEYEESLAAIDYPVNDPAIIVLSAASNEQLVIYARNLLSFINEKLPALDKSNNFLYDIAFTLQTGREALNCRLAVIASSIDELIEKLSGFCVNNKTVDGLYTGNVKNSNLLKDEETYDTGIHQTLPVFQLAESWVKGRNIHWHSIIPAGINLRRISLPTYPFTKKRYWIETEREVQTNANTVDIQTNSSSDLIERNKKVQTKYMTGDIIQINDQLIEFHIILNIDECDYLKAHILFNKAVMSGPTQIAMLFEAFKRLTGVHGGSIDDMFFIKPVVVESGQSLFLKLIVNKIESGVYKYKFTSRSISDNNGQWDIHSTGKFNSIGNERLNRPDLYALPGNNKQSLPVSVFYEKLEKMGYRFEESFKCIKSIDVEDGIASSQIVLNKEITNNSMATDFDPGIIDCCIQMLLPALPGYVMNEKPDSIYVPVFTSKFVILEKFKDTIYCDSKRIDWDSRKDIFTGSLMIKRTDGELIGWVEKFRLKRVDSPKLFKNVSQGSMTI